MSTTKLQSVSEQSADTMHNILVSIQCITYNQVDYIRDALDSFLMQKTSFPVEILIHDDASEDGTTEIIKEYEARFPHIIKPIYQKENLYSREPNKIGELQRDRAKGQYFAICEGDDYWIDPLKLEKQLRFMKDHPEMVMCVHNAKTINHKGEFGKYFRFKKIKDQSFIPKRQFIARGGGGFPTASIMMKASLFNQIPDYFDHGASPDFCIALHSITQGEIGYLQGEMSVYRVMAKNSWSSNISKDFKLKHSEKLFLTLEKFHEATLHQYVDTCKDLWKNLHYLHYRYRCMQESPLNKLKIIFPALWKIGIIRYGMLYYFEFIKKGTL